ncbi:ATP-binding protein [Euryhalocaulis caribicus]|uniref:ATP-binding protein n=1 Tax=Euryhalocaulis caribicus TaxID=1161401 RepID=UPI000399C0A4|nr:ATP-binding protein [Euryhalocaulis caribicus]
MTNKRTKLFSHPAIDEAAAGSARMWSARLVMIMLTLPLAYIGAGAGVALTWGGAILSAETLSFIATRPFRTARTRSDFQRGLYLFSSLYTILAWLLLGVLYWMTGEPALMITALAVLAGQLIYVQGFMHGSPITLAIGGIPATAALIGAPLLIHPFEPRYQLVLVGSLILMSAFAWRAARLNFSTRAALRSATDQLEDEKQSVEAASEAKSAFLATMSHEIRTPLNGMLGMAHALESDDLSEEQKERVRTIIDSGYLLTAVLNDVLDLSKIEAGKLEIAPIDDDFHQTLHRVVRLFEPQASDKGVTLSLTIDPSLPQWLRFDPVRVRQCLSNLLSNAVKFTAAGRIEVSARAEDAPDGKRILISVSDTGIGMSPKAVDGLFTPFTQADASITRRFAGTGLGLSIVRQLARLMGGEISAQSVEGEGSVFTLDFQVQEAEQKGPPETGGARMAQDDARNLLLERRILVADDNAVNRQVTRIFLAPLGCEIIEATDGAEAISALGEQKFDIVLMDIHMPGMDGIEAIRQIRKSPENWSCVPVVALTADAMEEDRARYLEAGMDGAAVKPLDQRQLFTAMATAVETRRRLSARAA